jgi:hypothetical protein
MEGPPFLPERFDKTPRFRRKRYEKGGGFHALPFDFVRRILPLVPSGIA